MQRLKNHFLIILFLLFYFGATSYKFITHPTPFYDWDESIYAQVGREMIQHTSIVPLWQGQYWLDKPPLVPLAYGIVAAIFPSNPELSTRMFTLLLTIFVFILTYVFYLRIIKQSAIAFLTVVITAFTGIFLQRAQVLNVDIFLLLGWMGYMVFYEHFWISLLFLGIGVLSKSLLGFYPAIGLLSMYTVQVILKQKTTKQIKKPVILILIQMGIMSLWFIGMLIYFKYAFIKAQFLDSQLKRVTASIESHFGKRTFYIDLLFSQLGIFAYLSLIGTALLLLKYFRKKDLKLFVFGLFFVPWFLFLNLTKTKINWYLYPVIAQFAFLGVYVVSLFNKNKILIFSISVAVAGFIIYSNFDHNQFLSSQYSSYDEHYELAQYARKNCGELTVLIDMDSRKTHDTLKSMNLLIDTSEWWGNHPALVYYSQQKVNFVYDVGKFRKILMSREKNHCYVMDKNDAMKFQSILSESSVTIKDIKIFRE